MQVAVLRLELVMPDCPNLREKRRRMQAIIEKLRRHFNVSVAEVDRHDWPAEAVLGVATVSPTRREARDTLHRVADVVAIHPRAELVRHAIHEV